MTVKEFFTKLNLLAQCTSKVISIDKGKIKIFINGLRSDIAKGVSTRDNPLRSYTKALGRVFRSEVIT